MFSPNTKPVYIERLPFKDRTGTRAIEFYLDIEELYHLLIANYKQLHRQEGYKIIIDFYLDGNNTKQYRLHCNIIDLKINLFQLDKNRLSYLGVYFKPTTKYIYYKTKKYYF